MAAPQFPKRDTPLLLPSPKHHVWIFAVVVASILAVVLIYAINPWFSLSDRAVSVIIQSLIGVFLVGVVLLLVVVIQLFVYVRRHAYLHAEQSKNYVVLVLTFLLSIMLFATVIRLLQPLA